MLTSTEPRAVHSSVLCGCIFTVAMRITICVKTKPRINYGFSSSCDDSAGSFDLVFFFFYSEDLSLVVQKSFRDTLSARSAGVRFLSLCSTVYHYLYLPEQLYITVWLRVSVQKACFSVMNRRSRVNGLAFIRVIAEYAPQIKE